MSEYRLELDPNEYGDLERFFDTAQTISRWHDQSATFAYHERPRPEDGEKLLRRVERLELLHEAKVCQEFVVAYQGEGDFASKEVVAEHIGNLLDCYPSAKITNPRVYVRTLVEEVYNMHSHRIVIEMACRDLKRTAKTPPSIAAVREAMEKREKEWQGLDIWGLEEILIEVRDVVQKLKQSSAPSEAPAPPGQRVRHEKYGIGTVVERDGSKITVDFDGDCGCKMLADTYVTPVEG